MSLDTKFTSKCGVCKHGRAAHVDDKKCHMLNCHCQAFKAKRESRIAEMKSEANAKLLFARKKLLAASRNGNAKEIESARNEVTARQLAAESLNER